ncbi:MAG: SAM-dependent methyltransferase [Candidatus Hydrothermales bacterium]
MEGFKEEIVSFKEFMRKALYGENGYYTKKMTINLDFVTPSNFSLPLSIALKSFIQEKSQGLLSYEVLEIGGGEGIFCENFLRVNKVSRYFFVEPSFSRMELAKKRLNNFQEVVFLNSLDEIKEFVGFIILIEVFDAFPFRRLFKKGNKFYEIMVNLKTKKETFKKFEDDFLNFFLDDITEDSIFEYSEDIIDFLKNLKDKLKNAYIILIDYAENLKDILRKKRGTARAFKEHNVFDDLYTQEGKKDITRTLNIEFLKKKFEITGYSFIELKKLSDFIKDYLFDILDYEKTLGIRDKVKLISQLNYLVNPEGMGEIFKVFVFKGSNP